MTAMKENHHECYREKEIQIIINLCHCCPQFQKFLKLMYKQIMWFLMHFDVLIEQFGFRLGYNTVAAVFSLVEQIVESTGGSGSNV